MASEPSSAGPDVSLTGLPAQLTGRYSFDDGYGGCTLLLRRDGTFRYRRETCVFSRDCQGVVQRDRRRLRLIEEAGPEKRPAPMTFVIVRLGPRIYLVPPDDLRYFEIELRAGREPRTDRYGMFLLKEGHEILRVPKRKWPRRFVRPEASGDSPR